MLLMFRANMLGYFFGKKSETINKIFEVTVKLWNIRIVNQIKYG